MKRVKIYKPLLAGIFLCLICAGICSACSDSESSGEETLTFEFRMPPALEVNTRTGTLDEILITDVWVVQYNSSNPVGSACIQVKCFTGNEIGAAETNQTIKVQTSGFSLVSSYFYVIANAGANFLTGFAGSQADLKAKLVDINPGMTTQPRLLVSERISYTPVSGGNVIIVAPLQRAFAKVSLKWNAPGDQIPLITIKGVDVYNLPKKMAFFSRAGSTELNKPYPAYSKEDETNFVTTATAVGKEGEDLPLGNEQVFYMAENLRGMGTGTSFSEKNLPAKGPGGALGGCTYLVLRGEYKYSATSAAIKVNYTIYLGGNLMNDYNIQRGTLYNLTVNINGANSADVRVTITDGNVVIFDEVEKVENKVEF